MRLVRKFTLVMALQCVVPWNESINSRPVTAERQDVSALSQSVDSGKITFTITDRGEMLGFTYYKSADGVTVGVLNGEFSSTTMAHQHLRVEMTRALKILQRSQIKDKAGMNVGERVVAVMRGKETHEKIQTVMWTKLMSFHQIFSVSLKHAIELERQLPKQD
jgi:hypothetical protein